MRGSPSRYRYADSRDNFTFQDGRSMGYFKLYTVEVQHLAAAKLSGAAIMLYLFIGTRCSGNREGFSIGGQQIQRALGISRSTIYQALRSLKDAGLVHHQAVHGRTVYSLANVDGTGRPMHNSEGVRNLGQESSGISDNRQDNSDSLALEPPPLVPPGSNPSTEQTSVAEWDEHSEMDRAMKDAGPCRRHPFDLAAAVWGELTEYAQASEEGEAVFERALEGDEDLVEKLILHFRDDPRWQFKHRRRWFIAAAQEAGQWGPDLDLDGINAANADQEP